MNLVDRLRRAFRGEPVAPEAEEAVADSRKSLARAISGSTAVTEIVSSLHAEYDKNHFIELIYATRGK